MICIDIFSDCCLGSGYAIHTHVLDSSDISLVDSDFLLVQSDSMVCSKSTCPMRNLEDFRQAEDRLPKKNYVILVCVCGCVWHVFLPQAWMLSKTYLFILIRSSCCPMI